MNAASPTLLVLGAVVVTFVAWAFIFGWTQRGGQEHAVASSARYDTMAIQPVAEKWVLDHPGQCPTVERLRLERELASSSTLDDPWGRPYRITCQGGNVHVFSDGPDRKAGTADDIQWPAFTDAGSG